MMTVAMVRWLGPPLSIIEDAPDSLLFTSPRGKVLRYQDFRNTIWLPALRAAGVPPTPIHALRHSAAAGLIHADASQ